jgi:transcriptional regulator with XRE-family HTH domain
MENQTQNQLADEIGTSRRTLATWKKSGVDITNKLAIANHIAGSRAPRSKPLAWAMEIIRESHTPNEAEPNDGEPIVIEENTLEGVAEYYRRQLGRACSKHNKAAIRFYNDLLLKTDKCIRETQAHERKLGLESGETMPRKEFERIVKAILFGGNACVRNQIKELAQGISMKTPQEIYRVLPAAILGGRIFEGLSALIKSDSEMQIPDWLFECFIDAGGNYLQDLEAKMQPLLDERKAAAQGVH